MQTEWKLTSNYTNKALNLPNEKNNSLLWIKIVQLSFSMKETCAVRLWTNPPESHAVTFPPRRGDEESGKSCSDETWSVPTPCLLLLQAPPWASPRRSGLSLDASDRLSCVLHLPTWAADTQGRRCEPAVTWKRAAAETGWSTAVQENFSETGFLTCASHTGLRG